jgi:hypothetical protein
MKLMTLSPPSFRLLISHDRKGNYIQAHADLHRSRSTVIPNESLSNKFTLSIGGSKERIVIHTSDGKKN